MTLAEKTFQQGLTALAQWLRFLSEQERQYQAQLERLRRTPGSQDEDAPSLALSSTPVATSDDAKTQPIITNDEEDEWL